MKQAMNFRFSNQARTTLTILSKKLQVSKTALLEQALQFYAKKNLPKKNNLLECAGIMNDEDADQMLKEIRSSRRNKQIDLDL